MIRKPSLLPLVAAMLLATGCGSRDASADKEQDLVSSLADKVAAEVQQEMAHENFGLDATGLPKAELTPEGNLLIDGKTIVLTDEQRKLAIEYREAIADVAERGARIGLQGAEVAKDAVGAAIAGIVSGGTADIDAQIQDSTERIKAEALKLCDALPALLAKEQALAAAVPEFAPYAGMTQAEIDDCGDEIDRHAADATQPHPDGAPHDDADSDESSIEEDATKPYDAT